MESFLDTWKNWLLNPDLVGKIAFSVVVLLGLWLLRRLAVGIAYRNTDNIVARYQWGKISGYVTTLVAVLIVGPVWVSGLGNAATYFGLLSAGLAIALQSLIVNFAGWVFILWRRPFNVGDRIQIGDQRGDVVDIRPFQFTLLEIGNWVAADQSTGRILHVPNGQVFTAVTANYSRGFEFIWNEIAVLVTFESNWRKAKEILQRVGQRHGEHLSEAAQQKVKEASARFMIRYQTLTPAVYTNVLDSGVLLTIRYLCEPRRRRGSQMVIWEDILDEFAACPDIDFAYPTQRFYNNVLEGKHLEPADGPKQD